jgi:hypothetical protein
VLPTMLDEIVEDRIWRGGVEIVSHVNWSHVARVRRSLGYTAVPFGTGRFPLVKASSPTLTVTGTRRRRLHPRAA